MKSGSMNVKETTYPVMHIIKNFIKTIQFVIDCLCFGFLNAKSNIYITQVALSHSWNLRSIGMKKTL